MAGRSDTQILKALARVRSADESAVAARRAFRDLMRREIAEGRQTKSSIARLLGVSRQRVGRMIED